MYILSCFGEYSYLDRYAYHKTKTIPKHMRTFAEFSPKCAFKSDLLNFGVATKKLVHQKCFTSKLLFGSARLLCIAALLENAGVKAKAFAIPTLAEGWIHGVVWEGTFSRES